MHWFIGCSGFLYRGWKPAFYPAKLPQRLWFEYYCERFNTIELNTTFYNFPKEHLLESWYRRSPEQFVFTVKATKIITHYKKFVNVKSLMEDFYRVTSNGLKKKLGPVLFQLPPNIHYSEEKLEQILKSFNRNFMNVIEFRHSSWWNDYVYKRLAEDNVVFCSISHPQLPRDLIVNSGFFYCRMHGTPRLYTSIYKTGTLQKLFDDVMANKKINESFVYFNNDVLVGAVKNASQLRSIASV